MGWGLAEVASLVWEVVNFYIISPDLPAKHLGGGVGVSSEGSRVRTGGKGGQKGKEVAF